MLFKIRDYGVMIVCLSSVLSVCTLCAKVVYVYMGVHQCKCMQKAEEVQCQAFSLPRFLIPLRQDMLLNLKFATSLRLAGLPVNSGIHSSLSPQIYGLVIHRHAWFPYL